MGTVPCARNPVSVHSAVWVNQWPPLYSGLPGAASVTGSVVVALVPQTSPSPYSDGMKFGLSGAPARRPSARDRSVVKRTLAFIVFSSVYVVVNVTMW